MIQILPPEEAKKIAAGEVIDRPAALVRELIDNALDSGAASIELSIEDGGIGKIELIDDGSGMGREDLALCVKPHATSKIQSLDDLSRLSTLGFRGEALAAAAAAARLEIVTSTDGREAWRLETFPSQQPNATDVTDNCKLSQTRRQRGTSVRSFGLFDAIPARRRFLKRESSEAMLCRQIFTEKAMAFPGVSFRFFQDGRLKLQLLPCMEENPTALQKRFGEIILEANERTYLHALETSGNGFTITVIFGGPELYRRDRKQQFIFANKRRVQDFGLQQALEYGLTGFFPNNSHPLGAVFVEVDPALADFNIHPAKREVRFADAGAIHHSISTALRNYVQNVIHGTDPVSVEFGRGNSLAVEALLNFPPEEPAYKQTDMIHTFAMDSEQSKPVPSVGHSNQKLADEGATPLNQNSKTGAHKVRLAGRVFNLFILAERGDKLYLIDQHAAHERLLYNHYLSAPVTAQELLVPIPFTCSSDAEDRFLQTKKETLARLGIVLESEGNGAWRIEALPAAWKTENPVEEILALQAAGKNFFEQLCAVMACRSAIKDGGYLDDAAALALAEDALALFDETSTLPRCPHGRPLWTEISRTDLFRAVRRIE